MTPDARFAGVPAPGPSDTPPATLPHPPDAARRPALGDDCWFLSGPTASGKTSLGVRLALRLDAEIVSVDSMAVYRGLDIGTAKPDAAARRSVPHHLVDVVEPSETYNVARWLADAADAVDAIRARGRRILFVGGTPLYLRALRDGLAPLPPADAEVRGRLTAEAEASGPEALHRRLAAADPAAAARIHPRDLRRVVRALEVAEATGRPLSGAFAPRPHPVFSRHLLVVDRPRDLLRRRIDERVAAMFAAGLVAETGAALGRPGGIGHTAAQGAGYSEAIDLLAGRITLAEAIDRTRRRTHGLAKRQRTWLRSFTGAVWITA